uniref:Uncharacterized protein n=1 Tax=Culex tarsalis TaxID=7177 RepID=A0A1Q3EZG8_CULTA
MDASVKKRNKKRTIVGELVTKTVIFDGQGGARCPWCPYHQALYLMGNFHRHILARHPIEAVQAGFGECKPRRQPAEQIPESLAIFVRFDGAEVHCQIANGQCRYSQPAFNLRRFQRHICLLHPWEAMQQNLSIEKNGNIPKLYEMVVPFVTYDANGIQCRIDPNSSCLYQLPVLFSHTFKRHFLDHHPEHSELYGLYEDTVDCSAARGVRTKPLTHLIEEYVYLNDEWCHCKLDPGCDFSVKGFSTDKLLSHFRHKHTALAKAKGFFEKRQTKLDADFNVRIWKCVQKDADGKYYCRINGECSFMQRKFYSEKFLQHFRYQHREAAREKKLFKKQNENRGETKRRRGKSATKYAERVRPYTETDENGTHCRIAGPTCEYVQSPFRPNNLRRHFRNAHPKEAKEHGFFEGITIVKTELPHSTAGNQPKKRLLEKPNFIEMVTDCTTRDGEAICCKISADDCKYQQVKFDVISFVYHFRRDHPEEAKAKGFVNRVQVRKKVKEEVLDDPLDVTEEVGADDEDEETAMEASSGGDRKNPTSYEDLPSMGSLESIRQLVEENTLTVKNDVFCQISTAHCDFHRGLGFDAKDFVRHFRFKHPDEAREKGFFGKRDPCRMAAAKRQMSVRNLVTENVHVDEEGIHCMISETTCSVFQVAFNAGNFVRHFCKEHEQEAEAKGFMYRGRFFAKLKNWNTSTGCRNPRSAMRALVENHVSPSKFGYHCMLTEGNCKYVQRNFHYRNYFRHFTTVHPVEALAAGFVVGQAIQNERKLKHGRKSLTQLVKQNIEQDETGFRCRISAKKCPYVQKTIFCSSNFVRHFRAEHKKEARKIGFFRGVKVRKRPKANEWSETESEPDTEAKTVAQEVKMESFDLDHNEPETICPDTPQNDSPMRKKATMKELLEQYVTRTEDSVQCRIAGRPCRYVQRGVILYQNILRHFRTVHPIAARAAGFFNTRNATSKPDPEPVERINSQESDTRDATTESFTREESQPEVTCPDTSSAKLRITIKSGGRITQKMLAENYIFRDEDGVHCRLSRWPCRHVQKGPYQYSNFLRHFRVMHPKEAKNAGFLSETSEPETDSEPEPDGEDQPVDPDLSEDERGKAKSGQPSLRRLTKKFVVKNAKGIHCRISSLPCRYVQKGTYKYTNFVRHFRTEHTAEASEAGFFRDRSEESEHETAEQEDADPDIDHNEASESENETAGQADVDPDVPLELDLGSETSLIEPRKAEFSKTGDDVSEPGLKSVGCISYDSITQDETMDSFTTERSQSENSEASNVQESQRRKPNFTMLAEKYILRNEKGIHCRISPWPCKYVQRSTYVPGNLVRHFRTNHPTEARKAGFFQRKLDNSESEPEPAPIEDVSLNSTTFEKDQQKSPCPGKSEARPKKIKRSDGTPTLTALTKKCTVRSEEGVHCRIVEFPPCGYVQRSGYIVGNFVRHFRNEHPEEAREIGFFKEPSATELESNQLELPFEFDPQDPPTGSLVLGGCQPEEPSLDTPHDDPALYCRLCFSVNLPLSPIFSGPDSEDNPLVESIEECISVRLTAEDDAWICPECSQKLVDFQHFRQLSRIHDSAVREKKQRLTATLRNSAGALVVANETDSFYVEIVKQETPTEPPATKEKPSATATEPCDDQKPFIELPDGTFSCRLCPETFPSLGPTMEHFISAHSETMHTNGVLSVDSPDKPPFKAITIDNVQYLKCTDCDTLTEQGEAIIEHRERFHTGKQTRPTIRCDRVACEQFFMDNPAYRRHLEIVHGVSDSSEGGS